MAIIRCPKCDGRGEAWIYQEGSSVAGYSSICTGCGGTGSVADYVHAPVGGSITIWIGCPHCHKQIEIQQHQTSYVTVMPIEGECWIDVLIAEHTSLS